MKRLALLALLATASTAMPASADHGTTNFVATGTILVGNPTSSNFAGITEQVSPCGGSIDPEVPDGSAQGVDGYWVELPLESDGHDATLTGDSPNNLDAWYYDFGCTLIRPAADPEAYKMATSAEDEAGKIPVGSAWVAVDLLVGANASFTFTVFDAVTPA